MEEEAGGEYYDQGYGADPNTRIRDLEERNKTLKERIILLGENLLETKEEFETEIDIIKKQHVLLFKEFEVVKETIDSLLEDIRGTVKRDEMLFVERMLKDFQPLEFMRKKDVEELIAEKMGKRKT